MNNPKRALFTIRPTITVNLPLDQRTRILYPEQILLKIIDKYYDIGALCYALKSDKNRTPRGPQEVVTKSLLKQRRKQILQLIKVLSALRTDRGLALSTTQRYTQGIQEFVHWADSNNMHDCLAGGEATRKAFRVWAAYMRERYQRQQIGAKCHNSRLLCVSELLQATTGLEYLMKGIRKCEINAHHHSGTQPLGLHDFVQAVAVNQCVFDGLCDLVLEQLPFPYKLDLPKSLNWEENHLWLFPTNIWRLPPHRREAAISANVPAKGSRIYDYVNGRLATVDEIKHLFEGQSPKRQRHSALVSIKRASARLDKANTDARDTWRLSLGMHAQRAFLFLFFCNTGGNVQVVLDLETDGTIDAHVQNQRFRGLKWRADGKEVTLSAPVTFMPRLRRFMELRQYLLNGEKTPYLFFGRGIRNTAPPTQMSASAMDVHYRGLLLEFEPLLPKMPPRTLRASVDDYYLRLHDSVVAAAVMGHTVETEQAKYARGSVTDHHEEMSLFMTSVSESARRQRVISPKGLPPDTLALEGGGRCDAFGHPDALAARVPIQPDCKSSQGCLFCCHRLLIAGEEDVRKMASAAYVMEQLILGPKHEETLRPLISKCDEDLEKIAAFPNCRTIVEKVRKDVYENENLTTFWADKYQLFLELGILL